LRLESFGDLVTIFLSILIEALPFVLVGVLVSSIISLFLSEDLVKRFLPKHQFLRLLAASLMGIIFPICECCNVLITRRLIEKGVPLSVGMTFLLATPIINPIVMASTYFAFPFMPQMVIYRFTGALVISISVGLVIGILTKNKSSFLRPIPASVKGCSHDHSKDSLPWDKTRAVIAHMIDDLFIMGKYLIIGSFLAATIHTQLSGELLMAIGRERVFSTLAMMALAYGLSICSEADAFVASSFAGIFAPASLTAFLLYGPMTDIKNTIMMLAYFKSSFVLIWLALVTVGVFLFTMIIW
jgi:uncharacterized protein